MLSCKDGNCSLPMTSCCRAGSFAKCRPTAAKLAKCSTHSRFIALDVSDNTRYRLMKEPGKERLAVDKHRYQCGKCMRVNQRRGARVSKHDCAHYR